MSKRLDKWTDEKLQQAMDETLKKGICYACGERIPAEWPVKDFITWEWPKGWGYVEFGEGILALECGTCSKEKKNG